jgi:hypothetical protein
MPRYSVFAHVNQLDLTTYRRMQLKNSTKHNNIYIVRTAISGKKGLI